MDVLTSWDPLWISEKVPSPILFRAHPLFICQISCTAQWRNMHFGNAIFGSSNAHIARRARPLYNFQKQTFSAIANINHSRAERRIAKKLLGNHMKKQQKDPVNVWILGAFICLWCTAHVLSLACYRPVARFSAWVTLVDQPPVGNSPKMLLKSKGIFPKNAWKKQFRFGNFCIHLPSRNSQPIHVQS